MDVVDLAFVVLTAGVYVILALKVREVRGK